MLAYSFQGKIHPTRFYLRAFYRQAAPNFAYSFIKFEEKNPAYSFIRELRVGPLVEKLYFRP
jgi:hypothetical protein